MVTPLDLGQNFYDLDHTIRRAQLSNLAQDENIRFTQGLYEDNNRYWDRYVKKHHIEDREIMFPYRSGYQFNTASIYSAQAQKVSNEQAFGDAMFRVAKNFTKFLFSFL